MNGIMNQEFKLYWLLQRYYGYLDMSIAYWTGANHHDRYLEIFPFCQVGSAISHVHLYVCQSEEVTTLDIALLCGPFQHSSVKTELSMENIV